MDLEDYDHLFAICLDRHSKSERNFLFGYIGGGTYPVEPVGETEEGIVTVADRGMLYGCSGSLLYGVLDRKTYLVGLYEHYLWVGAPSNSNLHIFRVTVQEYFLVDKTEEDVESVSHDIAGPR